MLLQSAQRENAKEFLDSTHQRTAGWLQRREAPAPPMEKTRVQRYTMSLHAAIGQASTVRNALNLSKVTFPSLPTLGRAASAGPPPSCIGTVLGPGWNFRPGTVLKKLTRPY